MGGQVTSSVEASSGHNIGRGPGAVASGRSGCSKALIFVSVLATGLLTLGSTRVWWTDHQADPCTAWWPISSIARLDGMERFYAIDGVDRCLKRLRPIARGVLHEPERHSTSELRVAVQVLFRSDSDQPAAQAIADAKLASKLRWHQSGTLRSTLAFGLSRVEGTPHCPEDLADWYLAEEGQRTQMHLAALIRRCGRPRDLQVMARE